MARLILTTSEGPLLIELRPKNNVGRHPANDVQLLDKIVSPHHCVLEHTGGAFVLRDLGTLNGTYVNGERLRAPRALKHGDEIALGATRARFDDGSGSMNYEMPAVSPGARVGPYPMLAPAKKPGGRDLN